MTSNRTLLAAAIAGILAAASPALADDHGKKAAGKKGKTEQVKCYGGNKCKGKSKCGGGGNKNGCAGKNECKGQGFIMSKSEAACKKAGGSTTEPTAEAPAAEGAAPAPATEGAPAQ